MEKHPPMMMVENLAHEATNQMLRDLFAEFNPRRVRIVYRNSMPKGAATSPLILAHNLSSRDRHSAICATPKSDCLARFIAGFAGLEFEREDQALAACRQRSGALVLGRPITCRYCSAPHHTTTRHDTHTPSRGTLWMV